MAVGASTGLRPPLSLRAPLTMVWSGAAKLETILDAASAAYFEVTGVNAVAAAEGIGPALYRQRVVPTNGAGGPERELAGPVTIALRVRALGRASAWMVLTWRAAAEFGSVDRIWVWRRGTRSAAIPEAARIGVDALDGPSGRR